MTTTLRLCAMVAALSWCATALGHGHPIQVSVGANNRLVVGGGVSGTDNGYVHQIYAETDSAGDPQDIGEFSNFGTGVYWIVPGLELSGLAENSGLYLQTIARPVAGTNPVQSRTLWYWNPNSPAEDKVAPAPSTSKLQIRHSPDVNTLLTPTTEIAPPSIKVADPLAEDMGFHNHDLLRFLLPYPQPADGAYAFFARFMSNVYGPSDPFMVVINNGNLEGLDMLTASAAINRDALLAGDYNHDDRVDGADYVLWRNSLNSTTQLSADGSGNGVVDVADRNVWKANFGLTFPAAGGAGTAVPEPGTTAVIAALLAASSVRRFRRVR